MILAKLTKIPMLEISLKEAESLALAVKNVLVHHKINISPSTLAYVQLIGVCLAVYGPRLMFVMAVKKAEADANKTTFENGAV
jgi:hypothetical protein